MASLFASFWRAVFDCLHPRVIALSMLPLLFMGGLAWALAHFYWADAVQAVQTLITSLPLLSTLWTWLQNQGFGDLPTVLAPLLVVLLATPLLAMLSLLVVALLMTPALVALVAQRRFPALERQQGGSFLASLGWSLLSAVLALVALVISMPLWLVPPLVLVLPPLIGGWFSYRVMAFDALAEHASPEERTEIFRRHRASLLAMGVLTGFLGSAPALLWASGIVFATAFIVLVPLAIWLYALVFAFSSLWFAHYCLQALQTLRAETVAPPPPQTGPSSGTGSREIVDVSAVVLPESGQPALPKS